MRETFRVAAGYGMVAMALLIGVFVAGSVSFVRSHALALDKFRETQTEFTNAMKADAAESATWLAVSQRTITLRPRDNGFISGAKERYLPNALTFSAWNVFGFQNRSGSVNPFLVRFDELSWTFIAALIISFIALLFTFIGEELGIPVYLVRKRFARPSTGASAKD